MPVLFDDCSPAEKISVQRMIREFESAGDDARMNFAQKYHGMYKGACDNIRANIAIFNDAGDIALYKLASEAQGEDLLKFAGPVRALHEKFKKAVSDHKDLRKVLRNAAEEYQLSMIAATEIGGRLLEKAKENKKISDIELQSEFEDLYRALSRHVAGVPRSLEEADASLKFLKAARNSVRELVEKIDALQSGPQPGF